MNIVSGPVRDRYTCAGGGLPSSLDVPTSFAVNGGDAYTFAWWFSIIDAVASCPVDVLLFSDNARAIG